MCRKTLAKGKYPEQVFESTGDGIKILSAESTRSPIVFSNSYSKNENSEQQSLTEAENKTEQIEDSSSSHQTSLEPTGSSGIY